MTQLLLQDSPPWLVENWLPYDWPVRCLFARAADIGWYRGHRGDRHLMAGF